MALIDERATVDQSIVNFLNSKWRPPKSCQVCGANTWNVEPQLAELRFLNLGAFVVGGPVLPLVVLTCNNCGNTIFINAVKAGWIPPTAPPPATRGGGQ